MAKAKAGVLKALAGKKIVLHGRFPWGVEDRLKAMAEAQQGELVADLDASVDYLVLTDLTGGKTVQKKMMGLNAKGASIQVLDADTFLKMLEPTAQQVLELLRSGEAACGPLGKIVESIRHHHYAPNSTPVQGLSGESFDGLRLPEIDLSWIAFDRCTFDGADISKIHFGDAKSCSFRKAVAAHAGFSEIAGSSFVEAGMFGAGISGNIAGCDFSAASLEDARFSVDVYGRARQVQQANVVFARANLRSAKFHGISLAAPDFDSADLTGAGFFACVLKSASFRGAKLENANLVGCELPGANFTNANLRGANLSGADLANATFDAADLSGCNLRGAKLDGVDLSKARNYDPAAMAGGNAGPSLTELDTLATQAKRIVFTFRVAADAKDQGEEVSIDTTGLKYGWGIRIPYNSSLAIGHQRTATGLSDAMLQLANLCGQRTVRYETLDVASTKSPKGGKELRDLVLNAIAEAFAQPLPSEDDLATATKAWRDEVREQQSEAREQRQKAREEAQKRETAAKKQIEKKIARAVGKVTDIASFLKALELRADAAKIKKATSMLKAEHFKLFNDITNEHLSGVVKSQTDPDLVYACRIDQEGHYACCTQNLNICGGLRGSICKHLLVLIVGLVKAGELDPTTIDEWVSKTHKTKPELDKETMGAIFIKYKGAEAGEVDWRPTETVPEDYYAL